MPKFFATIVFRFLDGSTNNQRVKIEESKKVVIGRSRSCDIILGSPAVSAKHARLNIQKDKIKLQDLDSSGGTFYKGKKISEVSLEVGGKVMLAKKVEMEVVGFSNSTSINTSDGGDVKTRRVIDNLVLSNSKSQEVARSNVSIHNFESKYVDIQRLASKGVHVTETDFLAVGGGLGSFTFVDHLRIFGVDRKRIMVIGDNPIPYGNYQRYCKNSQIPDHERLRSNSLSTPDNIWGFPGYASREAWSGVKDGDFSKLQYPMAVFGEPALAISYTPTAKQVFNSIERESHRIGWDDMFINGRVSILRKTRDGRFAVLYKRNIGRKSENAVAICNNIHLATGYPSVRFLDDLQAFKAQEPELQFRVVNAYAPHEEVYDNIKKEQKPFIIVIRGRGIVASRILQKLSEVRAFNPNITVIHLLRSKREYGTGVKYERTKRPVFNDVEIQPFNWPKACWGGVLRENIENFDQTTRAETFKVLGGTTTAERDDWTNIINDGLRDGWYVKYYGNLDNIEPSGGKKDKLRCVIEITDTVREKRDVLVDYIIDCTGLIADIKKSPFLSDLLQTYKLPQNITSGNAQKTTFGGFKVSNTFEIEGLRNGNARVFASGQLVSGGPYAAVDSFLGLQYCALRSVESLSESNSNAVQSMPFYRSFHQWTKWCRNVAP